jgi:hypothetical protein
VPHHCDVLARNFRLRRTTSKQLYGPKVFDTDFTVMKNFNLPRWEGAKIGVGLQFFNLFNHPNFDQPIGDIANPQFGSMVRPSACRPRSWARSWEVLLPLA